MRHVVIGMIAITTAVSCDQSQNENLEGPFPNNTSIAISEICNGLREEPQELWSIFSESADEIIIQALNSDLGIEVDVTDEILRNEDFYPQRLLVVTIKGDSERLGRYSPTLNFENRRNSIVEGRANLVQTNLFENSNGVDLSIYAGANFGEKDQTSHYFGELFYIVNEPVNFQCRSIFFDIRLEEPSGAPNPFIDCWAEIEPSPEMYLRYHFRASAFAVPDLPRIVSEINNQVARVSGCDRELLS